MVKKVYVAQQKNPCKGGWIELVMEDMKNYSINISEEDLKLVNRKQIKHHTFEDLINIKVGHNTV